MDYASVAPEALPIDLLKEITDDFSEERRLGSGAYSKVYMGVHEDGEMIAVKVFNYKSGLNIDEQRFQEEFNNLAGLQHQNIVRLVGYYYETQQENEPNERAVTAEKTSGVVCLEYMHNGSLDKHIYDEHNGHDWHTRYAIIKGICKGLRYLHEELKAPVYHLDLKPANVLLDENMIPKLTDFGLLRLFGQEQSWNTKSPLQTRKYIPPEYIERNVISKKFDIFSLGVVIIQIMSGVGGYSKIGYMSSQQFIESVHTNWRNRLQATSAYAPELYAEQVKRCIEIAISCVEVDRHKRPSIGNIVNILYETEIAIHRLFQNPSTGQGEMEAPVTASLGAMNMLVKKLDKLMGTVAAKHTDEFSELRNDLDIVLKHLLKLSKAQDPPLTARCWMVEVRELSYEILDCIDAETCWTGKISGFKARVKDANERYDRFKLEEITCEDTTVIDQRLPTVDGWKPVVGAPAMDLQIYQWLSDKDDQQLKVVSIVGVGGIGKTTVALQLWKVLKGFDCRAFVRTAKKPDMRRILISMLSQVRPRQPPDATEVHELTQDLRRHLQDKRYLLIIDDLWDTSTWDIVSLVFPEGNRGSRIIITTQIEDVALACCSYQSNYIFKMEPLTDVDSKKLFISRAFDSGIKIPDQWDAVLDNIIGKCYGLPQAIISIGSVLASRRDSEERWEYVHKFVSSNWRTETASDEVLKNVVKICYDSLPSCLQTCLLYLSVYPENYIILKEDLVKQWVAEGFICASEEKDVMEVAGSYFDRLVNLELIRHTHINYSDEVLSYTVHHMVRDLITTKSIEQNFVTVTDYSQTTVRFFDTVRRLSLQFGSATYATTPPSTRLSQVRSLIFIGLMNCMPTISEFKLLRVVILDLLGDDANMRLNLSGICEVFLLRYLQITCNVTVQLPYQMRGLIHLETLDINARVVAVPSDIVHLHSLLHLRLGASWTDLPDVIDPQNVKLNTSIGKATMDDSSSSACSPPVSLHTFELLQPIFRLPKWIGQLSKLSNLKIVVRDLPRDDIHSLEEGLPALVVLSLYVRTHTRIKFRRGAFRALVYFRFRCARLSLAFEMGAMPNLRRLKLGFNAHREQHYYGILSGIEHITELQEITGQIGANPSAEESYWSAAESAFKDATKQLSCTSAKAERVDPFQEDVYKFPYEALASATNNFSDTEKLGEGDLGSVYRGLLDGFNGVCIKRVSNYSKQGMKEYISKMSMISCLGHHNIVNLIGWCNDRDLLLVYKLMMPNGSLDTHLHRADPVFSWTDRYYMIVLGLASALVHLHEGCDECYVHNDIRPSNIILVEASFNAKLGDFGLERVFNHGQQDSHTTTSMVYKDPGCISGGATVETDMYSFGVVLLEIACGRLPVEGGVHIKDYVWNWYNRGAVTAGADPRLQKAFNERRMEAVMVVGLWCVQSDRSARPSASQALGALRLETPLPSLKRDIRASSSLTAPSRRWLPSALNPLRWFNRAPRYWPTVPDVASRTTRHITEPTAVSAAKPSPAIATSPLRSLFARRNSMSSEPTAKPSPAVATSPLQSLSTRRSSMSRDLRSGATATSTGMHSVRSTYGRSSQVSRNLSSRASAASTGIHSQLSTYGRSSQLSSASRSRFNRFSSDVSSRVSTTAYPRMHSQLSTYDQRNPMSSRSTYDDWSSTMSSYWSSHPRATFRGTHSQLSTYRGSSQFSIEMDRPETFCARRSSTSSDLRSDAAAASRRMHSRLSTYGQSSQMSSNSSSRASAASRELTMAISCMHMMMK